MPAPKFPVVQLADNTGAVADATTTAATVLPVTQAAPQTLLSESTTSRTSSGNGGNLTMPAGVTRVFVGVNLTALTGGTSPSVQVSLQQQDANGNFQTIGNHTALTATGVANFSVGEGQTNGAVILSGGTYRFAWTITGSPSTCSFQIGASAR